jgi:hypothetical protein
MFIKNPHGSEAIQQLAAQIGLVFGETLNYKNKYQQSGRPGFAGNTFSIKEQLKAAGAKWDGENKAWTFESWDAAEAAIKTIIQ